MNVREQAAALLHRAGGNAVILATMTDNELKQLVLAMTTR